MPKITEPLPQSVSLKKHWFTWHDCSECPLYRTRDHVAVLYRWHRPHCPECKGEGVVDSGGSNPDGSWINLPCPCSDRTVPIDVLFLGEAPGESEDLTGLPFTGPSGNFLKNMIHDAQRNTRTHSLKIMFTNTLACIPVDESVEARNEERIREPQPDEVAACRPRLEEFIMSVRPTAIVLVGKVATRYFPRGSKSALKTFWFLEHTLEIIHPAALLRSSRSVRDDGSAKARLKLERLFKELSR